MPSAKIVYVNVEQNKFNEEQTQLSIGFEVDGGETKWMRYTIAGGSEGQQKFASMQLSKLLKLGGPVPVTLEVNSHSGKDEVFADDGFRSGGGSEVAGGF